MHKFNRKEIEKMIKRAKENQQKIEDSEEMTRQRAVNAFKDHQVRVLTNNEHVQAFECRNKNGSWQYGFRVICADNLITMYGDVGELVVLPGYNRDGVRWLRGSIDSKSYFVEKIDGPYRKDDVEFSRENAIDAIFGYIYDDLDEVEEYQQNDLNLLNDCLNDEFEHENQFYEKGYYEYDMDEMPSPTRATANFEYRYQALKRLCELLDEIDFSIQREEAV